MLVKLTTADRVDYIRFPCISCLLPDQLQTPLGSHAVAYAPQVYNVPVYGEKGPYINDGTKYMKPLRIGTIGISMPRPDSDDLFFMSFNK